MVGPVRDGSSAVDFDIVVVVPFAVPDIAAVVLDIAAGYLRTGLVVDKAVAACHGKLVYSGTADPIAAAALAQVGTVAADVRTNQHINKVRFSIVKQTAILKPTASI